MKANCVSCKSRRALGEPCIRCKNTNEGMSNYEAKDAKD